MSEKVNLKEIEEVQRSSPGGKYGLARKHVSGVLGVVKDAPFDVEQVRLSPGKINFPCHAHQVQWEFFMVLSGAGVVRRDDREFRVGAGDCFMQQPGMAHQVRNPSEAEDLVYVVIADNPPADIVHYPDSDKWMFRPLRTEVDYYKGEE